jgi:hypothetical protein
MGQQTQKNEFQISGKVLEIHQPEYISPKLTKRNLVLEVWTGQYSNQVVFECKNERGKQLDDLKEGQWAIVTFELTGKKVVKEDKPVRYYNGLNVLTVIKG